MGKSGRINLGDFPKDIRGSAFYYLRTTQHDAGKKQKRAFRSGIKRAAEKDGMWQNLKRGFSFYNECFERVFGSGILNVLKQIPRAKGKPLIIIDDGAGHGEAVKKIKEHLRESKVPCKVIALGLTSQPALRKKRDAGLIDETYFGPAEDFVPKERVHAVISSLGSVAYTDSVLMKDHLLKFVYSLKKGGIMLVSFSHTGVSKKMKKTIDTNFVEGMKKAKTGKLTNKDVLKTIDLVKGNISDEGKLKSIKIALNKRGFEAFSSRVNSDIFILGIRRTDNTFK